MLKVYWAADDSLPSGDRGLAYGDGLFETIRVSRGQAPLVMHHLERLVHDAMRLGIRLARPEIESVFASALERYGALYGDADWILKLVVTRGTGGRGYRPAAAVTPSLFLFHASLPVLPPASGVSVDFSRIPLTVNPLLAGIKSLNRLEQVMAASEIKEPIFELLMSNADGHVVEGTRTNIFLHTPNGWVTPPAKSLAVSGVMRRQVIERLHTVGEPLRESDVEMADLLGSHCQGLYLTNSVLGVVPVRNLAGHDLPAGNQLATICDPHKRPD
ncbi:aminodeoxychorismate lyase [Marinobacter sp. VGCF2001]|uniref:aminodeoxychorismate lyase n=1 Tax=Marinobacter sp. VGCF2001 TaxID=3417189 RepID=UPI003CEFAEE6